MIVIIRIGKTYMLTLERRTRVDEAVNSIPQETLYVKIDIEFPYRKDTRYVNQVLDYMLEELKRKLPSEVKEFKNEQ